MADKTIGQLPVSAGLDDNSLLVMEQGGEARSITGALVKQFAKDAVAEETARAEQAANDATEAKTSVDTAKDAIDQTKADIDQTKAAIDGIKTDIDTAKSSIDQTNLAVAQNKAAAETAAQSAGTSARSAQENATLVAAALNEADGIVEEVTGLRDETLETVNSTVKVTAQMLTDEQKSQARENIGAVSTDEVAQTDYEENDETSPAYLKNRPFFDKGPSGTLKWDEENEPVAVVEYGGSAELNLPPSHLYLMPRTTDHVPTYEELETLGGSVTYQTGANDFDDSGMIPVLATYKFGAGNGNLDPIIFAADVTGNATWVGTQVLVVHEANTPLENVVIEKPGVYFASDLLGGSYFYPTRAIEMTLTGGTLDDGLERLPGKFLPENVLKYTAQTLTEEQQAQARENIGVPAVPEWVTGDYSQSWDGDTAGLVEVAADETFYLLPDTVGNVPTPEQMASIGGTVTYQTGGQSWNSDGVVNATRTIKFGADAGNLYTASDGSYSRIYSGGITLAYVIHTPGVTITPGIDPMTFESVGIYAYFQSRNGTPNIHMTALEMVVRLPEGKLPDSAATKQYVDDRTPFVTPESFGAVGDGVTDDSVAIQAAIDAGASQSMPVYLPKKNYKISTGLVIRNNYAIFRCDGTLTYDGEGAAVTLTNTLRSEVDVNAIYAENGTAVRLDNAEGRVTFCRVDIGNIRNSKVGVHLITSNTENMEPIYYNKISYMDVVATEIGVRVEPIGYYINENRYYGGTIGGGCFYGIRIGNSDVPYSSGANKFLSGGLEGISDDGYGIYLENSDNNIFKNIRTLERYGKHLVGFAGTSKLNHIEVPRIVISEIDITNLGAIGNENNVIECMGSSLDATGGASGNTIQVNGNYGIVYDTKKSNNADNTIKVSLANFPDGVIKPINNRIYSSFQSTVNSLNGQTITLGETYYGTASLLKGEPLVFSFGSGTGRIKLVDTDGNTIFDATDGKFDNKTISVKWSGYWGGSNDRNLWDISIEGQYGMDGVGIASVEQTTQSSTDGGENIVTVTLTNGTTSTFAVKNGSKGSDGAPGAQGDVGPAGPQGEPGVAGADGHTPVKGTDYFTDADIQTIVNAVYAKVADGNGVAY